MPETGRADTSPNDEDVAWYVERVYLPFWIPAGCLVALIAGAIAVVWRLRKRRGAPTPGEESAQPVAELQHGTDKRP